MIVFDLDDTLLDTTGILIPIAGTPAFEKRIQEPLPLMPGALENLEQLRHTHRLFLLTQGNVHFQRQKVRSLNIENYFEELLIFDPASGKHKSDFFQKVQRQTALAPELHLSVGNRLSTDLIPAKRRGWKTCLFRHGEHQDELAMSEWTGPANEPDFTVLQHQDLIRICHL